MVVVALVQGKASLNHARANVRLSGPATHVEKVPAPSRQTSLAPRSAMKDGPLPLVSSRVNQVQVKKVYDHVWTRLRDTNHLEEVEIRNAAHEQPPEALDNESVRQWQGDTS